MQTCLPQLIQHHHAVLLTAHSYATDMLRARDGLHGLTYSLQHGLHDVWEASGAVGVGIALEL